MFFDIISSLYFSFMDIVFSWGTPTNLIWLVHAYAIILDLITIVWILVKIMQIIKLLTV
jgi:hypothetical protein